jgi:glycosyltransferase involved in cell wall biosynthesis
MKVTMLVRNACVRDARVLREAASLAAAGHDLTVVAMLEPGLPREERRDGFTIVRVEPVAPWLRRLARRPAIPASTDAGAQPRPAREQRPPLGRRSALLYAIRDRLVTAQITRAALAHPAEVVHAHDLNTLEAGVVAAKRHGARLVYDAHELYPELSGLTERERRRWRAVEARLIGRADAVITVSDSLADELVKRYAIARPTIVRNVPDRPARPPDRAASPLTRYREGDEMLVLYSGGISPNRGLEALADAVGHAQGWRLVMMGWGRLHDELRAREPRIIFHDAVAPEDLIATAAGADVGVIPYVPVGLNNALSLPNKLFEYIHARLAIVASDLVELRRYLNETGAGVTVPPGDPQAIADALNRLAADRPRREAMQKAAQAASDAADWSIEAAALTDLYQITAV